jgi:SAM-dependent methyltransferase
MSSSELSDIDRKTIGDFGSQWTRYSKLPEHLCSKEQLIDHCGPLFDVGKLIGARVLDIGSGSGCVVMMLINAGVARVTAVEPSKAIDVCRSNTVEYADRIDYVQAPGDQAPLGNYDAAFSLGVLHHILDPGPVVRRVNDALKPGGTFVAWIYGREGNGLYLAIMEPVRKLTKRLPDSALTALCWPLALTLSLYAMLCRVLPLPMRAYMREVIGLQSLSERVVTIFDQLNPAYAKYYTHAEAIDLLASNGFVDVSCYHRHGYSWTVAGRKAL